MIFFFLLTLMETTLFSLGVKRLFQLMLSVLNVKDIYPFSPPKKIKKRKNIEPLKNVRFLLIHDAKFRNLSLHRDLFFTYLRFS